MDAIFNNILEKIKGTKSGLYRKDFLLTWEKTFGELETVLAVAEGLKYLRDNNISARCFD